MEMISRVENNVAEFDSNIPNSMVPGRFDHGTHNYILKNCDENTDGIVLIDLHNKRSDRKNMEGANQVKWSRNNITATMERFEPTRSINSMSPTPSLDYGFAATVVNSKAETNNSLKTPHFVEMTSNDFRREETAISKNHIYSYAYYDPEAVKYPRNMPRNGSHTLNTTTTDHQALETSNNTQHNYVRTLLPKAHCSKPSSAKNSPLSLSVEDRHTFTTRYGTTENLYEEVNEQKIRKVFSDNRIVTTANSVKEEIRRVHHNHFRVLDELNLSLEALIMPPSSQKTTYDAINTIEDSSESVAASVATGNALTSSVPASTKILPPKPRRYGLLGGNSSSSFSKRESNGFSTTSLENFSNAIQSENLKDQLRNSNNNTDLDEGDLDSGFSGSGSSSGNSYNESLRFFKSIAGNQIAHNTKYPCCSPSSSAVFTSKNSLASQENSVANATENITNKCCGEVSPKSYDNECTAYRCIRHPLNMQDFTMRSTPSEISTVTKSKKGFWTTEP
ncbi:AP2/ERF domain-containing protein PFD0985w [Ceratitis capitata]|uniref:AP2/ERF domain-containing protein PFD0985w n=1 Tax=Ceratitis capitata TaxID=7213 RepID=UPI000329911A|nr:AP2/ERF domain-containing protein PFD0985w [Ceratitis capitata]